MFRYFVLLSCFFSLFNSVLNSKSFLWEVKSDKNTVYILGSVHLADSTLYPLNPIINEAFDKSKFLVLEIDITNINPYEVLKYTTLPDTLTLSGVVDKETFSKFKQLFKKHNVPESAFQKLKPWFAVMTLQSLEMIEGNYSAEYGIDMHFLDIATNKNLKIKELESLEFQMKVLDTLNQFTGKFLDFTLDELDKTAQNVDSILIAWKNGDTGQMSKIINEGSDSDEFQNVMQFINYSRNINMVKKIEDYLNQDEVHFIIVGAAHLIDDKGIIALLNSKNKYTINQK